jgi:hypothetical protein
MQGSKLAICNIYGGVSGSVIGVTLRSKYMALLNNNFRSLRWVTKVDQSFVEQKDCVMSFPMMLFQLNVKLWNREPPKVTKMKWMDM